MVDENCDFSHSNGEMLLKNLFSLFQAEEFTGFTTDQVRTWFTDAVVDSVLDHYLIHDIDLNHYGEYDEIVSELIRTVENFFDQWLAETITQNQNDSDKI